MVYWLPYSSHTSHHPWQTACFSWISYATQKLSLKHSKAVWSIPYIYVTFFPSLKQNFIAYRSSKLSSCPDCIFEIHQLWQWGFSRVYSNSCCSCSFEREIIKIGQSSHKMYSNNILNFQESTTILNVCTKKSEKSYWMYHVPFTIIVKFQSLTQFPVDSLPDPILPTFVFRLITLHCSRIKSSYDSL